MKHRTLWMGVLLGSVLLLAACSGGQLPAENQTSPEPPEAQDQGEEPTLSVAEGTETPIPVVDELDPTPSVPFEQGYGANPTSDRDYSEFEIVTLLPPDGIPALTNPSYYGVSGADKEYEPDEMVIGIEFNGDARAYSIGLLSSHEIVNDTVGGIHLAVSW